jgi:hypothetical protein
MPPLSSLVSVYNTTAPPASNVLNLLSYFAPDNRASSAFTFGGVSVANHTYTPLPSVDLEKANTSAITLAGEAALNPKNGVSLNNDWFVLSPTLIGIYGANYALRTAVASTAYLALRNPFAIYPTYKNASASGSSAQEASGSVTLAADEALLVTFSSKPPLKEAGFWSLTAYGSDDFLIPNSQHVYALGDRSNLTYPDGTAVYGSSSGGAGNKPYQILLQPADVPPPTNWTTNWLPAPSGGGVVIPQLRFYGAETPLTDGSYVYPRMEKVAAIKGSGSSGGGSPPGSSGAASSRLGGVRGTLLAGVIGVVVAVMML